jgi:hypothetical protein
LFDYKGGILILVGWDLEILLLARKGVFMDLEVRIESLGVAKIPGEDYNAEFYHVIDP